MKRVDHNVGMLCPECGHNNSSVLDSRPWIEGAVKRRRECDKCFARWSTSETIIDPDDLQKAYDEPHCSMHIYIPERIANALKNSRNSSKDMRTLFNAMAEGEIVD